MILELCAASCVSVQLWSLRHIEMALYSRLSGRYWQATHLVNAPVLYAPQLMQTATVISASYYFLSANVAGATFLTLLLPVE